jgi:flagellar biosynthesis protein FlhA
MLYFINGYLAINFETMTERRKMKEGVSSIFRSKSIVIMTLVIVVMLIIPFPALLIDIFISLNLIFAIIIFLFASYVKKITSLSFYPKLLLVFTIFNLAVNLSATSLILRKGPEFDGRLIKLSASIIAGSEGERLKIGIAIFILIIAVHVLVVAKGCTRISEVAARFTLDSFQVRQMVIDAKYNYGVITENEAALRKEELKLEVDFYSSMDVVSKYFSGNERLRILIITVSSIGAIFIGILYKGQSINDAVNTYIPLVISNGILCMLPSVLLYTAVGSIIARFAKSGGNMAS